MAPLEFVLVYPTFLAILCCCMWIAVFFLRKAEVTIAARYSVDSQRLSAAGGGGPEPFEFVGGNGGRVEDSKSAGIRFSGFMPAGRVTSRYSAPTGTWDHVPLPMDVVPDYALAARLGGRGPVASPAGQLAGLTAMVGDLGDMVGSMDSLLGLGPGDFFSGFGAAVEEVRQGGLGESDLVGGGQNADISKAVSSLNQQTGPVAEIADIYRNLVGESGNVRQQISKKAEGTREAARQLESNASGASAAFDDAGAATDELDQALDNPQATPEQKVAAIKQAREKLSAVYREASKRLASGGGNDAAALNKLVAASFRKGSLQNIPDVPSLSGLTEAVNRDGLAGFAQTSDSLLEQLSKAVEDKDAGKEKELRRSLDFVTDATEQTLRDTAAAASEMKAKVDGAADRASRLGQESAMPAID